MKAMLLGVACVLFISVCTAATTSTVIPFKGIPVPPTPGYSLGQVFTGVSDVGNIYLYTNAVRPGSGTTTLSVAEWTGSAPSSPFAIVSVTLSSASSWSLVTVSVNLVLDPVKTYVFYLTFTGLNSDQYIVATKSSAGAIGGFVRNDKGVWASNFAEDIVFGLSTNNLLAVNAASNSAQGPCGTSGLWSCTCLTTFSAIQVDWITNRVNTGYFGSSSTSVTRGTCTALPIPYGTAAECGFRQAFAKMDLSGTKYYVPELFVNVGYLPNGSELSRSANQQVLVEQGSGDCGFRFSNLTYNIGYVPNGETYVVRTGGLSLQLARLP